ncbi:MAG: ATP-binding protein, partial [Pseudomonadota bacterium]
CSSPTGPAFEGAQISAGQRAAPGAIERVEIDPQTRRARFKVIGCDLWSDEPGFEGEVGAGGVTGICGSGIIEVIAEMRLAGIIDEDGAIGPSSALPGAVIEDGRTWAYVVHDGRAADGPLVTVTQTDVRAIQLAKAALYAGARLLMDQMEVESVERVVLAGAFGAHISPKHAMVLGMIPDCPLENVTSAGNAAGTGARIALLNRQQRREIEAIVRGIEKVETAVEPRFQEHFVAAMAVPHKTAPYPHLAKVATLPDTRWAAPEAEGTNRRRRRARA